MKRLWLTIGTLLVAHAAFAQQDVVARHRAAYPTPMTAEQKVALLRGVATEVHGGLLVKRDGNNCLGFACDIVCFSATALFDVLQAEGEAAIPTWNATSNPRGYACELVTSAPAPEPSPVVPPSAPVPSVDLSPILNALALQAVEVAKLEAELAAHVATEEQHWQKVGENWKKVTAFVGKYILPAIGAWLAGRKL